MKRIRVFDVILTAFVILGLNSAVYSADEQKDVGLITEITGTVSYSSADSKSGFSDAVVFMKVRSNDCLKIAEKSSIVIIVSTVDVHPEVCVAVTEYWPV